MRAWERTLRTMVLWGAYVALVLFFIIPVGIVQALIEVPRLASVPVLGTIVNLPVIKQVLEGIVPGLVLLIFLALLPSLLAFMCRLSGCVSNSAVDFGVVERYFYFQVLTIFLGSIISGSLLSQLKLLQSNPGAIIRILGVGIPQTATFFINFILVAGIGKAGIKHLRLPGLVIFWLLSKMASTPRARARLWADQYTTYGPNVPGYTIAFLLGLVYCNINPIIAPVVLLYMTFSVISERYNDLYVFKRTYESGGRLWLYAFNQFIICVYIMQVAMLVLLSIKGFQWVPLLIPAPFITLAFHVSCLVLFNRPWTVMSAHDAAMLDLKDATDRGDEAMSQAELQEIKQMYQSPVFKVHKADIDDLLREAAITSRRINGESLEDIEAELEADGYQSAEEDADEDEEQGAAGSSQPSYLPANVPGPCNTPATAGPPAIPATTSLVISAAGVVPNAGGQPSAARQQTATPKEVSMQADSRSMSRPSPVPWSLEEGAGAGELRGSSPARLNNIMSPNPCYQPGSPGALPSPTPQAMAVQSSAHLAPQDTPLPCSGATTPGSPTTPGSRGAARLMSGAAAPATRTSRLSGLSARDR
ncbi:hypothetical protein V8C86DRAFT_180281 [Haematococcus lacustris]